MKTILRRLSATRILLALVLSLGFLSPSYALDVNTATAEELQTLKRVGPKRAAAIIRYREENGSINSAEELMKVPGIGPSVIAANGDELTFSANKSNFNDKETTETGINTRHNTMAGVYTLFKFL